MSNVMGNRLSPKDQALSTAVDEILHYVWDPIGVCCLPQARDEYHGYLPHVFGLLRNGAGEEGIAAYLGQVASDRMGLSANPQHAREVASVLVDWRDALNRKFAGK
jgi:hypothetical protein